MKTVFYFLKSIKAQLFIFKVFKGDIKNVCLYKSAYIKANNNSLFLIR